MRPPPRVCLVAPLPPPYGGIARWAELITGYAARTGEACIRVVDTSPRWRDTHDLRVWPRLLFGTLHGLGMLGALLFQLIRGAQILHLTTSGQLAICRDIAMIRLARCFGVPVLYHLRFGRVPELASAANREWRLLVKAMRLSSVVLPIDRKTEEALRESLPELRLHRIPNCVDEDTLPPILEGGHGGLNILLFVGWVLPTKGVEELLDAWERMETIGWRLVFIGPVAEDYLRSLQARFRMEGVEFCGELPHREVLGWMAKADLFTLPSHTEGFPNVVAEAMALGRPIVASAVGAIPEMLDEGGCGLLVRKQDAAGLRAALSHAIQDASLRNALGGSARERFRNYFTLKVVFGKLVSLWGIHSHRTY